MMRDVVQAGTATRAKVLGRKDLAGKTGTTNDYRDAWFNGYTESLVAVIWVGHDDFTPLGRGEAGGKAALPGWITYMREALVDVPETLPEPPAGIVVQQTGNRSEYFDSTVQADFVPDPVAPADAEVARPEDELF
jgi:penicillin-binding protein 1A